PIIGSRRGFCIGNYSNRITGNMKCIQWETIKTRKTTRKYHINWSNIHFSSDTRTTETCKYTKLVEERKFHLKDFKIAYNKR
ncbi:hypothetical protein L9F63_013858, partial [Diploptera punctata]